LNSHLMLRTFAFCLNGSAVGSANSLRTQCSGSYRGLSECAMLTSTWITTSGSLELEEQPQVWRAYYQALKAVWFKRGFPQQPQPNETTQQWLL